MEGIVARGRGVGLLVGVGVGPGDPELVTLGAVRALRHADVVCLPRPAKKGCRAYEVAELAVPEIADKDWLGLDLEMTRDPARLERARCEAVEAICARAARGETLAFVTLGDPSVYSTFWHVAEGVRARGVEVRVAAGVPAFCASAASLVVPLCLGNKEVHVLSGRAGLRKVGGLCGTRVLMKCGGSMPLVKETLRPLVEAGRAEVLGVSDVGLACERRYFSLAEIPDDAPYMTTVIVRELGE